jgi:hypothetical protein
VVIEAPEVVIEYPLANWSFAVLPASGSGAMLEPLEPGRWRLVSTTPGTYVISLDGHGDDPRFGATFVFGWIVEPE